MPTEIQIKNLNPQKPKWKTQPSRPVRVPDKFITFLIAVAKMLDDNEEFIVIRKDDLQELAEKTKRRKKSGSMSLDLMVKGLESQNMIKTLSEEHKTNG
ncbi:hypothetical protein [Crocosphaera subtropica]|uniref:hypothetical protein n=1 Tax=Crocosphaera subtropica TaxID=2546360 RepID=UPI0004641875|nr:hypothetical protein [Crocosphaera subtropica]